MRSVIIRADASTTIGGGHVMRCMSLAAEMHFKLGWQVIFAVTNQTLAACVPVGLDKYKTLIISEEGKTSANEMCQAVPEGCDILIIDHYKIGLQYEKTLRRWAKSIVVIDDLANRNHDCDVIVDQTAGRLMNEYQSLVPVQCKILTGAKYALLRPEFKRLREAALMRRLRLKRVNRILVSPGMTDPSNVTNIILEGIIESAVNVKIDIIMGSASSNLDKVRFKIDEYPDTMQLHIDCSYVGKLMSDADLAFGAAGSSSWERCCVGLPTYTFITAPNQELINAILGHKGAAASLGKAKNITPGIISTAVKKACSNVSMLQIMSKKAADICDGAGVQRLVEDICV